MATVVTEKPGDEIIDLNEILQGDAGFTDPSDKVFLNEDKPQYQPDAEVEQMAGEIYNFFQREVRKRLYLFVNIHRARNAVFKELKYIDEPGLDELKYYLERLKKVIIET